MFLPSIVDHNCIIGMASANKDAASETTSLSVVDREVLVCFLHIHEIGMYVRGPNNTNHPPEVLLVSSQSPAKSAPTYNLNSRHSDGSPTLPVRL